MGKQKKTNQSMEIYFKHYVNFKENNWVSFLPITQLAHNNKKSNTTRLTPFFANYGKHPELFHAPKPGPNAHKAMVTASDMTKLHEKMADAIIHSNNKIETRVNSKKKMAPQLKEGDKMYFLIKNFKTKKPNKKLDHVKIGPFLIKKVKGPFDYELKLPTDVKIFSIFNISLLEPANPDTPMATTFRYYTGKKDEYEMEFFNNKMVKIISSNGRIVTRQKIFGNRSKFLGIAKLFCDSSTKINSRSIETFKNEIFRNHVKQKVFKFKTNLFGNLFFNFQFGYMRDFAFDQFFFSKTSISRCKRLNLTKASLTF